MQLSHYIHKDTESNYYRIKVTPGSPKTEFYAVLEDGTVKIRVAAPREKNKANTKLIEYIADEIGISKSQIHIVGGYTDAVKIIRIDFPR